MLSTSKKELLRDFLSGKINKAKLLEELAKLKTVKIFIDTGTGEQLNGYREGIDMLIKINVISKESMQQEQL